MAKYWRGDEDLDENERERLRLSQGGFDTDLGEDLFFRDTRDTQTDTNCTARDTRGSSGDGCTRREGDAQVTPVLRVPRTSRNKSSLRRAGNVLTEVGR